ncbi:hypothetical protein [Natronosporangium hydrolyticum]|uniref:hypothetical protein n=1 Tax=Natronosporangium hydrolyticum TaxID=2811111 RepID=UPI001EFA0F55|nr:hypothetical protein [Natronosporangium hydrolyticum]
MFDFGLAGYQPCWLRGRNQLASRHGPRLQALAGRRLTRTWVVWDETADAWLADCPVVLDFDGERLEVNHQQRDLVSLTWNSIDLRQTPRWSVADQERKLGWRGDAPEAVAAAHGQQVAAVALLEWTGEDEARGSVAVGLRLASGWLTVYNALDENGLAFGPLDPAYQPPSPGLLRRSRPGPAGAAAGESAGRERRRTCLASSGAAWMWNRRPSSPT